MTVEKIEKLINKHEILIAEKFQDTHDVKFTKWGRDAAINAIQNAIELEKVMNPYTPVEEYIPVLFNYHLKRWVSYSTKELPITDEQKEESINFIISKSHHFYDAVEKGRTDLTKRYVYFSQMVKSSFAKYYVINNPKTKQQ